MNCAFSIQINVITPLLLIDHCHPQWCILLVWRWRFWWEACKIFGEACKISGETWKIFGETSNAEDWRCVPVPQHSQGDHHSDYMADDDFTMITRVMLMIPSRATTTWFWRRVSPTRTSMATATLTSSISSLRWTALPSHQLDGRKKYKTSHHQLSDETVVNNENVSFSAVQHVPPWVASRRPLGTYLHPTITWWEQHQHLQHQCMQETKYWLRLMIQLIVCKKVSRLLTTMWSNFMWGGNPTPVECHNSSRVPCQVPPFFQSFPGTLYLVQSFFQSLSGTLYLVQSFSFWPTKPVFSFTTDCTDWLHMGGEGPRPQPVSSLVLCPVSCE